MVSPAARLLPKERETVEGTKPLDARRPKIQADDDLNVCRPSVYTAPTMWYENNIKICALEAFVL